MKTLRLINVDEQAWKETILQKLEGHIDYALIENVAKCGQEEIYKTCECCGRYETFFYRCSLRWCPLCNWRLSRARARLLDVWSQTIRQPKHIVLTQRNFQKLTPGKIAASKLAVWRLRRTKIFDQVKGGCISTEITNDTGMNSGWHLHHHLLVDARFVPQGKLAMEWGKQIGQQFGIVKVMDARNTDYRREVCKYVVKASQMASWSGTEIAQFILAIKGRKFFTTFGSMFKLRGQIRDFIESTKPENKSCECGSTEWRFETEAMSIARECRRKK